MFITTEPSRILIVDDDEDDFYITNSIIKDINGGNFKVDWCFKYQEALDHICHRRYDLYFIDYFLGAKTGLDLLREAVERECEAPMILLTGKGNQTVDIEAMRVGAADYLIKSELTTEKMERCIRYSLEKARSLKALRDNELKYRNIFERSKDAIFLADTNLQFFTVNAATAGLLGYTAEELSHMTFYNLMLEEQDASRLKELLQTGEVDDVEIDLLNKNREERTCIFSATIIERPDKTKYVQGILHDITGLRKAEKSVLMAEKLAATGRLARTLAHEIRNPLTNIHLSLDHLRVNDITEAQTNYFGIIQRNAKRIGAIISELLDTARPTEMMLQQTSLQDILDESITAAMDRIVLKNIKLQIRYPDNIVYIPADKDKLKIAFLNIIINAVEAMEEEEGKLVVAMVQHHQTCEVRITDNGTGITEDNLQRLFEPYFTSKRNGLGLGLAATLNILQAHRAEVDVHSAVGSGTTFIVTFSI
ncbi:hybrid sensor histidine kinase/response regulator [Paraflavitalea soli]|uniref:histidine kinase n=1 Tax=Paraflavitalea soli TaxID=2315862 RepID=A0A3B7MWB3_9BACT|nr:hybrid sensor histidine kinase/response regulator [Paraflavitalea soli]AXY78378.1 hybrid sensor histidine kinase/response regulator [Paraflavitalea soli]